MTKNEAKINNRFQFAVCKQLNVFTHSLAVHNWCGRSYVITFVSVVDSWFQGAHSLQRSAIYSNELLKRHFNAYLSVPAYLRSHWFVTCQCGCADQVELNRILFAGKAKMNLHISPTPENAKHYWSICIFTLNWSGDLTTIFLLCWILTLKFSNYCQLNINNEKLCERIFRAVNNYALTFIEV